MIPLFWAIQTCLTRILPVLISPRCRRPLPTWLLANVPKPKPRPVPDVARLLRRSSQPSASSRGDRRGVHHRQPASAEHCRAVDVLPAERDRVHVRRMCELVDDLLAREVRLRRVRRPERAALERAAVERLRLRQHPALVQVARAVGGWRRRRCRTASGRRSPDPPATLPFRAAPSSCRSSSRPGRSAVQSARDDLAVCVDAHGDVVLVGGAVAVPSGLVPAHPLEAHRLADLLRDERGLLGRLGLLAAAVASPSPRARSRGCSAAGCRAATRARSGRLRRDRCR